MELPNFEAAQAFNAALAWERDRREEAFLGFVAPIRGVPVQPLSVRRLLYLLQGGCSILHGGGADAAGILQFLWIVSPKFRAGDLDARALSRRTCSGSVRSMT